MRMRSFGLWLALCAAGVVYAEVKPGDVRSAQPKDGATLRAVAKPFGEITGKLPYGTRVTVVTVEGAFAQVRTDDGKTGWVRSSEVVQPSALTGGGATGPIDTRSAEVAAAGRQFDAGIEGGHRASSAELQAAYAQVDALTAKSYKPGAAEIQAFIVEGGLGGGR